MRRRRRQRNIWLPVNGSAHYSEEPSGSYSTDAYGTFTVDGITAQSQVHGEIIPLTVDHNLRPDEFGQDTTLGEVLGNEYILRRIVGNIHACHWTGLVGTPTGTYPANAQVVAAFFVAPTEKGRSDDSRPVGYDPALTLGAVGNDMYNPLNPANSRSPWIWRKRWVLSLSTDAGGANSANLGPQYSLPALFPRTTMGYGTMRDGGAVDAKTIRRVRTDERLFFVIAAQLQNFAFGGSGSATQHDSVISWSLDYRLLGGLRRARQKGAF